ncbi:uncharacterized protein F4812DRAFT_415265 [Daldinia caldariorum]|uniref:uncharacterized protein n=1 Tax=Daldinia caldariorum TaxID=326644 RepID=UPI0020087CD1|nr:uncharacterized protein F4812DRAFT_415265 [Daldinia caldariorum]KAI1471743.1 hypothetical protein F4812DRAFT_415265 [Daldinia caldariorum]
MSSVAGSGSATPAAGSTRRGSSAGPPAGSGGGSAAESLATRFERIENAGLYGFTDYEASGFHHAAPYFLHLYTQLIQLIGETTAEMHKAGGENEKDLFNRGVTFLETCHEFVRDNAADLMKFKEFHYKLWVRLEDFSSHGWTSYDGRISRHITRIALLLGRNTPPPAQSWEGDTLPSHRRFLRAYDKFMKLDNRPLRNDQDRRTLMMFSQDILNQALLGLRMPRVYLDIQTELFREGARPTYIDFPYGSDEWLYGLGKRPGVLELRRKIGGPLTPEQEERIKEAKAYKEPKVPKVPKEPTEPKQSTTNSKKRPAPVEPIEIQPGPKRPRISDKYTITIDNVEADLQDIYYTAAFLNITEGPNVERLLNPTVGNREETLVAYKPEFSKVLRQYRLNLFRPEDPPARQQQRDLLLRQMDNEIPRLRAEIHKRSDMVTSAVKLKEARVAAFALKFIRTLYMKLLLASDPPPSTQRMRQALRDRLDDWILHEQAWNAADERAIKNPRTADSRKVWLMRYVDSRNENIERWWTLRDQLDGRIRDEDIRQEVEALSESSEEEQEGEEPVPAPAPAEGKKPEEKQPVEGEAGKPAEEPEEKAEEPEKPPPFYWLHPRKPTEPVFADERAERRREERFRARCREELLGPPEPGQSYLDLERYRLEDEASAKLAAAFPEHGGPPGFESIPRDTVYDKIMYMLVLSHWRYFMGITLY